MHVWSGEVRNIRLAQGKEPRPSSLVQWSDCRSRCRGRRSTSRFGETGHKSRRGTRTDCLLPVEVVLVRMCSDINKSPENRLNYRNSIDGLIRISREEGLSNTLRGLSTTLARSVVMNASQLSWLVDQVSTFDISVIKLTHSATATTRLRGL
jgi:hypothetical protein